MGIRGAASPIPEEFKQHIIEAIKNPSDEVNRQILQSYQSAIQPQYTNDNQLIPPKIQPISEEEIKNATDQSILGKSPKDLAEFAMGTLSGIAKTANPAQVPHVLETLLRMPYVNQDFIGRTKKDMSLEDRYKAASEQAVIPEMNANQIEAGLKTAGKGLIGAITGNPRSLKDLYSEEINKANLAETAAQANPNYASGEKSGNIASVAMGGIDLVHDVGAAIKALPKIGKNIQNMAAEKAFEALKPLGKTVEPLIDSGKAQKIGQQALNDGIITPGASFKTMLSRSKEKLKDYGEQIGFFAKAADKAVEQDSSLRGVSVQGLTDQIQKEIITPLSKDPSTKTIAKQVEGWVEDLQSSTKGGDLSFQEAQKFKTNLGKTKAKFQASKDDLSAQAYQNLYSVLNEHIETGISTNLSKAAPDMVNGFEQAKESYSNIKPMVNFLRATVGRQAKNRMLSPTDYGTGLFGALAGFLTHGPQGAVMGASAGLLNKLAREHGNQAAASLLNSISKLTPQARTAPEVLGAINQGEK